MRRSQRIPLCVRSSLVLTLLLVSRSVLASDAGTTWMPTPEGQRAWSDFESEAAALEADTLPDCSAAFKALTSLTKATGHLCALAPERCQTARARLQAARDRVQAACPALPLPPSEEPAPKHAANLPAAAKADEAPGHMESEASKPASITPKQGGCASCTQATSSDLSGTVLLALGVLAFVRRTRRRSSP